MSSSNDATIRIEQIDTRLRELRAEREELAIQKAKADELLARAVSEGKSDPERKKLRAAAGMVADRSHELDSAIRFLEADRQQEEGRAKKARLAKKAVEIENLRKMFIEHGSRIPAAVREAANAVAPVYASYMDAADRVISAQADYARLIGDDRVYDRASVRDLPALPFTGEDAESIFGLAGALARYARTLNPPAGGPEPQEERGYFLREDQVAAENVVPLGVEQASVVASDSSVAPDRPEPAWLSRESGSDE